jgi:4-hydroxybenzoate polyprenyltransferase
VTTAVLAAPPGFWSRWWTYFRERFPLEQHGGLVAVFALSTLCHSALLRGEPQLPRLWPAIVAVLSALLFYLLLRVLDEFKDLEDDRRWRPYRAVPRGLVSLRGLAMLGVVAALGQLALALSLTPALVPWLVGVWVYAGLMGVEFFVRPWLRAHPTMYLVSHAVITPLVALYVSAIDWLPGDVPDGLGWLLATSYLASAVVEIGRKLRAPADEEPGVQTYTALWGRRGGVGVWLALLLTMSLLALGGAARVDASGFVVVVALPLLVVTTVAARGFLREPLPGTGRRFVQHSTLWVIGLYVALGPAPLLVGRWTSSAP